MDLTVDLMGRANTLKIIYLPKLLHVLANASCKVPKSIFKWMDIQSAQHSCGMVDPPPRTSTEGAIASSMETLHNICRAQPPARPGHIYANYLALLV